MKFFIIFCLLIISFSCLAAAGTIQDFDFIESEALLSTASHYVESILLNSLNSLNLIASTNEAKEGDWTGIKKYLELLNRNLPAVYFYVLPDGNYYSLDLDYTNLNLYDREYFASLFAGNPVKGYPIFSRSSGKKSALMAVPIIIDGKVTGALGSSVFLDELNERLNGEFALPETYTWFVLNAEGLTMLDADKDNIFMNPLQQGSESLKTEVTKMLKKQSGTIELDIGGIHRKALFQKLSELDWWFVITKGTDFVETPALLNISLENFTPQLQNDLMEIDRYMAQQLLSFNYDNNSEGNIRSLLSDLIADYPAVVTASFVDLKGIIKYNEPSDYKNFEGSDISRQKHVLSLLKNKTPVFSDGFESVEGFLGIVISHPVFHNQKLEGAVNLLIRPESLIEPFLRSTNVPTDYELWIMQKDGMIIYDQDKDEIGRMLFTDPLYADFNSLRELGRNIAAEPHGKGEYIFLAPESSEKVIKIALWNTLQMHDQEWRVVLAYKPHAE
jgi:hypothetical protein